MRTEKEEQMITIANQIRCEKPNAAREIMEVFYELQDENVRLSGLLLAESKSLAKVCRQVERAERRGAESMIRFHIEKSHPITSEEKVQEWVTRWEKNNAK